MTEAQMERIRLVIWDLDETFWHGTLTEGGIALRPEVCRLVIELAERGVMSSICSKNDLDPVRKILVEEGLWEYFIFPSIDWRPKGPRIAALVEQVGLRPPTVMFIDDNPLNLEEARHFLPELEVRGHDFIQEIASSPMFVGKVDRDLRRLSRYKLLEKRKTDEVRAGSGVADFLQSCNIRVELEHDLERNVDRVVELINRTNQLNFTKKRLSEEPDEARQQAIEMLNRYNIQAALVRVIDRYGDHGYSGFYAYNSDARRIEHFCFSCRVLGLGIEHWLYDRLGRPDIAIKGEVQSDLAAERPTVDWINRADERLDRGKASPGLSIGRLIVHGGCDLAAVSHYFTLHQIAIIPELDVSRHGLGLRTDHSVFLDYARRGVSPAEAEAAGRLHYSDDDFRSVLFSEDLTGQCVLLSFATDAHYALYEHSQTGLRVPCYLDLGHASSDGTVHGVEEIPPVHGNSVRREVMTVLKSEFRFAGLVSENDFKRTVLALFERIRKAHVFVLRPRDYHMHRETGQRTYDAPFVALNRWTHDVAADFDNVELIDIADFAQDRSEIESILHYDRKVYFRVYEHIVDRLSERRGAAPEILGTGGDRGTEGLGA